MLGFRRAARRSTGFFLLGVLAAVSLSACDPAPQAIQTPTSDSIATPTPLPDLVIAIEARLQSNPRIVWRDGCIVSSSASLPFLVEITTAFGG